ncbi:MAG: endonuclease domain-containing protein [Ktedonobacteraceae bacterium]
MRSPHPPKKERRFIPWMNHRGFRARISVRALLCSSCNQAYGCLKEDPARIRALLAYAERWHPQK